MGVGDVGEVSETEVPTLGFPCDDPKYLSSSDIRSWGRAQRGPGGPGEGGAVGVGDTGQTRDASLAWTLRRL